MQRKKKSLSILFIGNSHTYYNYIPLMVKSRTEDQLCLVFDSIRPAEGG